MMRKLTPVLLTCLLVLLGCNHASDNTIKELSGRYPLLIEAPKSQVNWERWRIDLKHWKDSLLSAINYNDTYYNQPDYAWASKAYSTFFLMANSRSLYDDQWNYTIRKSIDKYEKEYGGIDIVLLWATYPQLGFDNRDQFSLYRNLPGGTAALRKLCDELHAMGKKLFIAYNPWDNIARENGKKDEEELVKLIQETGADGIFLDTISSVEGFRNKLNTAKPGVVFQSEISPAPDRIAEIHQSWLELFFQPFKNSEFDEVPYVVRNRYIEQRHMVYQLSRWSHDKTNVLQSAWINGCGVIIWENVFGTVNPVNARDRSIMSAMLPVLRRYSDFFTKGKWTPLFPTLLNRTYSSLWEFENKKLWTIVNRQEQIATGKLFEVEHTAGTKYWDLITGKEAKTVIMGGKASIYIHLKPRGIGGILAIGEGEVTSDLMSFLAIQVQTWRKADFDNSYELPGHALKPVSSTRRYSKKEIPTGMISMAVPPDSLAMEIHFRQRECGFYPAEGVTDFSYSMALDQPGVAHRKIRLRPYAMDETPVTNEQFAKFVNATKYKPEFADNFLKDWENGNPSKGTENHPVTWIAMEDARAYARWAGKRLPTEEEWQWAAQSGDKGWLYPWGNEYDSMACNHGQTKTTSDVARFKNGRTAQGLYDLCGNVWQLTESERTDGQNTYCIVRGGSWYATHGSGWYADQGPLKTNFASKYLLTCPGLDRCATLGFRCVVDLR